MESILRKVSLAAAIGMFLVLMMGATVTNTGSGEGCGDHWPLCHGEFIPSYTLETAIEYSHRLVTGIEGFLIMGTAVGALLTRRRRWDIRILVALMVGSLFLQAGMGAWAVKATQSPEVLALHFGFSLICVASTYMVMMAIREGGKERQADRPAPPARFGLMAWGALIVVYIVAYLGAYVRHANAELGCGTDWPLCNGRLIGSTSGAEGTHSLHRVAAFLSILFIAGLVWYARQFRSERPDIYRGTLLAGGAILLLSVIGGAVVISELSVFATLAHAGAMGILFVLLCDVARRTVTRWSFATAQQSAGGQSMPVPAGD